MKGEERGGGGEGEGEGEGEEEKQGRWGRRTLSRSEREKKYKKK